MLGRRKPATTSASVEQAASTVVLDGIEVVRGHRVVLRNVSFALEPGTLTAVVGPNGAGKSSLFGAISGRLPLTKGALRTTGAVAEVLQNTALDDGLSLTVDDVVRIGRYRDRGLLRPMRAADRRMVDDAISATDLVDLRRRAINQLSGGQRQRALLAQGLAQQAPILLLDEPTAGLDRPSQRQLLDIARAEADRGTTIIMATHSLDEAAEADNLIVLACDCLCCAPPPDALSDPAVAALLNPGPSWTWGETNDDRLAGEVSLETAG